MSPPAASAAKIGHAAAAAHPEMQRAVADGPHNIGKKHTPETDGVEPAQLLLQSCDSAAPPTPSCNEAPRAAAGKLPLLMPRAAPCNERCNDHAAGACRSPPTRPRSCRGCRRRCSPSPRVRAVWGTLLYRTPCHMGYHAVPCRICLWKHSGSNLARFTKVGTAWIMPISSACKRCSIQLGNPSSD